MTPLCFTSLSPARADLHPHPHPHFHPAAPLSPSLSTPPTRSIRFLPSPHVPPVRLPPVSSLLALAESSSPLSPERYPHIALPPLRLARVNIAPSIRRGLGSGGEDSGYAAKPSVMAGPRFHPYARSRSPMFGGNGAGGRMKTPLSVVTSGIPTSAHIRTPTSASASVSASPVSAMQFSPEDEASMRSVVQEGEVGQPKLTRPKRKQVKRACTNCQKACKACADVRPCPRCVAHGDAGGCVDRPRKGEVARMRARAQAAAQLQAATVEVARVREGPDRPFTGTSAMSLSGPPWSAVSRGSGESSSPEEARIPISALSTVTNEASSFSDVPQFPISLSHHRGSITAPLLSSIHLRPTTFASSPKSTPQPITAPQGLPTPPRTAASSSPTALAKLSSPKQMPSSSRIRETRSRIGTSSASVSRYAPHVPEVRARAKSEEWEAPRHLRDVHVSVEERVQDMEGRNGTGGGTALL